MEICDMLNTITNIPVKMQLTTTKHHDKDRNHITIVLLLPCAQSANYQAS